MSYRPLVVLLVDLLVVLALVLPGVLLHLLNNHLR